MIYDGFLTATNGSISSLVTQVLPYLVGRLDTAFDNMPPCRDGSRTGQHLFRAAMFDSIAYTQDALEPPKGGWTRPSSMVLTTSMWAT